jgi:hypothetical protein
LRTSSHIATIAAVALFVATLVSHAFRLLHGPSLDSATMSPGALSAFLEGIIPAVLVWVGTYSGARWAAPQQRTARLAQVLGILYFLIGVAISLPIKTHAVLLGMPTASRSTGAPEFLSPFVASVVVAFVAVAVSLFLARGLAATCGETRARDA